MVALICCTARNVLAEVLGLKEEGAVRMAVGLIVLDVDALEALADSAGGLVGGKKTFAEVERIDGGTCMFDSSVVGHRVAANRTGICTQLLVTYNAGVLAKPYVVESQNVVVHTGERGKHCVCKVTSAFMPNHFSV